MDDCADAIVHLTTHYSDEPHVNMGTGEEVSIRDLAQAVQRAVGLDAELIFDATKPDGTQHKLMDSSRLRALGWAPRVTLQDGLRETYRWYLSMI